MEFSRQEYWIGCHFLLQGIFPIQGSNPGLLLGRQILYHCVTWEAHHNEVVMIIITHFPHLSLLKCEAKESQEFNFSPWNCHRIPVSPSSFFFPLKVEKKHRGLWRKHHSLCVGPLPPPWPARIPTVPLNVQSATGCSCWITAWAARLLPPACR